MFIVYSKFLENNCNVLMSKYKKLSKLCLKMQKKVYEKRPVCEDIINELLAFNENQKDIQSVKLKSLKLDENSF